MRTLVGCLRMMLRLGWLATEIGLALARFVSLRNRRPDSRALWLHHACRRCLRVLNVRMTHCGAVPTAGLLVSNHLSYLDIIVLGALTPAVFVAKREVKCWPVFGWLASLAGTLFVDRCRRLDAARVNRRIQSLLDNGVLVTLFPEGTSSDGENVLPFKSSLLEPAAERHTITAAGIRYSLPEGDARDEICYWRDMTFLPHLLNILSKSCIEASVSFNAMQDVLTDRKQLARRLRSEVVRLKESFL
jgi:lyso-ornithine lipid O-acyltransferase